MEKPSFSDIAIVSCGTLTLELKHLKDEGFLDGAKLLFTTPGLHEDIHELERQLLERIAKAKEEVSKVLVVYGGKFCYVNADEPTRTMGAIIEEQGAGVVAHRSHPLHGHDRFGGRTGSHRPGSGRGGRRSGG